MGQASCSGIANGLRLSLWQAFGKAGLTRGSSVLWYPMYAFVCLAVWGCWPRWLEFPLTVVGSLASMERLLGLWQPARNRAAGSKYCFCCPAQTEATPTKVSIRDFMGKWWPAGSGFCSSSDMDMRF